MANELDCEILSLYGNFIRHILIFQITKNIPKYKISLRQSFYKFI